MSKVPQSPSPGNPPRSSRDPNPWIDLIAFLAILVLGGVLIAVGAVTAGSLATVCAALGGLYGLWKRFRPSRDISSTDSKPRDDDR
jgi:hypothetical protein